MLLNIPYKQNDTVTIKTLAGEEVVSRFIEETDTTFKVNSPMSIVASQQGIGLGPFAFTIPPKVDVIINKSAILMITKTDDEMAKQYVQSTTGIAI